MNSRILGYVPVLVLAGTGIFTANSDTPADNGSTNGTISAGALARHAGDYYGKTVSVEAKVKDVLGSHMFTVDEDAAFVGPDLLVLVPDGMTYPLVEDQKVTITGTVRRFAEAELERDFGWFERGKLERLRPTVDWETLPVVMAISLRTAPGAELFRGRAQRTTMTTDRTDASRVGTGTIIVPGKLARQPKDYYGRTVTVRAAVADVLGPHMFTLDEDSVRAGADVLVVVARGMTVNLSHDEKVVVTGKVRPFSAADLERDFDWFERGKLAKAQDGGDWQARPVIVADSVRTEAGVEVVAQR